MTTLPVVLSRAFNWKLFLVIWGLSVAGVIAVIPYSLSLQAAALEGLALPIPLPLLITLQVIQSAVIFGALAGIGLYLAGRLGLGAPILEGWLRGEPVAARARAILVPALAAGVLSAVAIIALDLLVFSRPIEALLAARGVELPDSLQPPAWQGLLASFYGGITEEVLLRLFLLTLIAWLGSRLARTSAGRPTPAVLWTANILAAVLFGLGHLPATAAAGLPLDALVVTRAVLLNGLAGLAFGWLFWTHGLESAMLAHFSADIVLHVAVPLVAP